MVIVISIFIDVWKKSYEKEKKNPDLYMAKRKQDIVLLSRYGVNLTQMGQSDADSEEVSWSCLLCIHVFDGYPVLILFIRF